MLKSAVFLCVFFGVVTSAIASPPPIQFYAGARGGQQVQVAWSGVTTPQAMIYRDDQVDVMLPNPNTDGHSAILTGEPLGEHTYKVCEQPTALRQGRCTLFPATITVT